MKPHVLVVLALVILAAAAPVAPAGPRAGGLYPDLRTVVP